MYQDVRAETLLAASLLIHAVPILPGYIPIALVRKTAAANGSCEYTPECDKQRECCAPSPADGRRTCWPPCSEQRDRLASCQRAFPARRLPDGCEVASRFSRAHRGDIEHLEHSRLRVELAKLQDELMHVERGDGANETKARLRAEKERIFAMLRNHST